MRAPHLLCISLLLAAGSLARAGDLQQQGFGEAQSGLVMRLRKAKREADASPLFQGIDVEIRAVAGKAALLADPFPPKFLLQSEDGKPLPEGVLEFPSPAPLERAGLQVVPGKPLKWTVRILRTSDKAPQKLTLRGALSHVGSMRHGAARLSSAALDIDLSRLPLPKTLEKKHLDPGRASVVYHLYQGLNGWRMLDVQPDGTATVFRSKVQGDAAAHGTGTDLPSGSFTAKLTSAEQKGLAASLLTHRVWTLQDLPQRMLIPDESSATLAVVAGEAAMFARYPIAEAEKLNDDYGAFQNELDLLMHRIVKRAQKGRR